MGTTSTMRRYTAERIYALTGHEAAPGVLSMLETAAPHGYQQLLAQAHTSAGEVSRWVVAGYAEPAVVRVCLDCVGATGGPTRPSIRHAGDASKIAAWTFSFDDAVGKMEISLLPNGHDHKAPDAAAAVTAVLEAVLVSGAPDGA